MNTTPVPTELRVSKDRQTLTISFDDGSVYALPAELLRVMSPSAEVQGHNPAQRKILGGKENVEIMTMEAVGNYAVRITFDDMHSTGIYTWGFFHDMGSSLDEKWQSYLDDLEATGLSRNAPGMSSPA